MEQEDGMVRQLDTIDQPGQWEDLPLLAAQNGQIVAVDRIG